MVVVVVGKDGEGEGGKMAGMTKRAKKVKEERADPYIPKKRTAACEQ